MAPVDHMYPPIVFRCSLAINTYQFWFVVSSAFGTPFGEIGPTFREPVVVTEARPDCDHPSGGPLGFGGPLGLSGGLQGPFGVHWVPFSAPWRTPTSSTTRTHVVLDVCGRKPRSSRAFWRSSGVLWGSATHRSTATRNMGMGSERRNGDETTLWGSWPI